MICLDQLNNLEDITLLICSGFWKNIDEFTLIGICRALSKTNLKSVDLRFTCETPNNYMSYSDKKKFIDNLCQLLPTFILKLEGKLTGLHIGLKLDYYDEFTIPNDVLQNIFISISRMRRLTSVTLRMFGLPIQNDYPDIVKTIWGLLKLEEISFHLDFLTENTLLALLSRLKLFKRLHNIHLGSNYLSLDTKPVRSILSFVKNTKCLSRRSFEFKCKNPDFTKTLEGIR